LQAELEGVVGVEAAWWCWPAVVPTGSVLGLLGPNGAGKTTAVRILTTLLRADAGHAEVAGFDVRRQRGPASGWSGQHAAVDEILSGRSNLVMFGRLYGLSAPAARRRADELLEQFGLRDAASRPVGKCPGACDGGSTWPRV
jgi:ABC-2 type transport system ATP-binding protein